uniref:V-type proton ATPase subunit a n=1 Tax=Heligmosomoides polygyrus TaxID=6339 RepID=A0A8L8KU62_HELPZ
MHGRFVQLNEELNSYQRKFVNEVRRCEEMERKLKFIGNEVEKDEVEISDCDEHIPSPQPKNMVELEANFEKLEEELISINKSSKQLMKNHVQLLEMKAVLEKVQHLLDESTRRDAAMSIGEAARGESGPFTVGIKSDIDKDKRDDNELKFLTGVISRSKVISFERFIWRFCRGKVFVRTADITEKTELFNNKADDDKAVFILFFSGEQLRTRVKKICSGFHGTIYNCPELPSERAHLLAQINSQVNDMQSVISKTLDYRRKIIFAAALSSIFHTLNMFSVDVTHKCLIAECWVPTVDLPLVRGALRKGTEQSGSTVHAVVNEMETHQMPPTHFKLNKFTQGFQNIVDAYGIANYREVNPAPWSIISFPFLFAVMFGDSGHGIIMLLAALGFVVFEKRLIALKIKDEIFNTFFGGRYVVLLMGMFSIYTGLLYNDIYSKSIDIFGSSWKNPYPESLLAHMEEEGFNNSQTLDLTWPPEKSFDSNLGPYPFGLDPVWNIAKNRLNFLNPMKMKTSIILGIAQMSFGLLLSLCNHIHNRSVVDVLFVFIPQVFFLSCIFVYLCVMVVLKWIFFYVNPTFIFGQLYPGSNCAPSLLIGLINMFMLKARDVSNQFTRTDLVCYFSGFHKSHRLLKGFVKQLTSCVTSTVFSREH